MVSASPGCITAWQMTPDRSPCTTVGDRKPEAREKPGCLVYNYPFSEDPGSRENISVPPKGSILSDLFHHLHETASLKGPSSFQHCHNEDQILKHMNTQGIETISKTSQKCSVLGQLA